jgi:protein-tyrosine phosphatase
MSRQIEFPLPSAPPDASPDSKSALADIHSHLVPGVDDGARDIRESLAAIDRLAAVGVRHVLTTPHVDASVVMRHEAFGRLQRAVEEAWATVVERCRERHPDIEFHLGREIMLDTAKPDLDDPRVRLNGSRYVLVEFPRLRIPDGSENVLYQIAVRERVPVVAHVERYFYEGDGDDILGEWRAIGAAFQVNAASLVGKYGPEAQALAWDLLSRGWVDLLASDYHARGETWIREARAALREQGGEEQDRVLLAANPRHIIHDEPLENVPPLPSKPVGRWWRLRRVFRIQE